MVTYLTPEEAEEFKAWYTNADRSYRTHEAIEKYIDPCIGEDKQIPIRPNYKGADFNHDVVLPHAHGKSTIINSHCSKQNMKTLYRTK